jgi:hypothetical protein
VVLALRLIGADMMCEPEASVSTGNVVPLEAKVKLPAMPGAIVIWLLLESPSEFSVIAVSSVTAAGAVGLLDRNQAAAAVPEGTPLPQLPGVFQLPPLAAAHIEVAADGAAKTATAITCLEPFVLAVCVIVVAPALILGMYAPIEDMRGDWSVPPDVTHSFEMEGPLAPI